MLYADEREACRAACLVDHGVDGARFAAVAAENCEPEDVASLPRPRIGFVGGIDSHTFDPELLADVAAHMPEATFVLVGAVPSLMPWAIGFAVGALIYLVLVELLPESYRQAGHTSIALVTLVAMGMVVALGGTP